MKYGRNLILEYLWNHAEQILYVSITTAVIIVSVNSYSLFCGGKVKYKQETDICTAQEEQSNRQDALYMEETRLSGVEIYLQEMNQNELSSGYLVTAEMAMLAQLVQAEAGNQDLTGKRLVADVVLNRVESEQFPNTIREVIFQKNPVQFGVTVDGAFGRVGGMYQKNVLRRCEWNGNGKQGLTKKFCISTLRMRTGRIRLSMVTIGLVIREKNMFLCELCLCLWALAITHLCRKSFEEVHECEQDLQQQLNVMEMRLNALLERIGGDDENMGR